MVAEAVDEAVDVVMVEEIITEETQGYQGHNRRNQHHQHNDEMDWEYGNGSTNQQQPRGFFTKLLSFKSNTQANKSDQTWLDCGANNNFAWDRSVFVYLQRNTGAACRNMQRYIRDGWRG